eukprot:gnl/MRDRNA2_/MRDRNA2_105776_c0_seq1.p1 gnl/MRDRNA2_/MRDRNA2_105776_c0~~gnl/MRDRNA2_/MRDRNA2_105776_c0_seq1.p1  ORF type:complete len:491 (+),score=91.39 gnl/MRDRNA2_/MRDRNA2_105776_c0_seq1:64-1536(+)
MDSNIVIQASIDCKEEQSAKGESKVAEQRSVGKAPTERPSLEDRETSAPTDSAAESSDDDLHDLLWLGREAPLLCQTQADAGSKVDAWFAILLSCMWYNAWDKGVTYKAQMREGCSALVEMLCYGKTQVMNLVLQSAGKILLQVADDNNVFLDTACSSPTRIFWRREGGDGSIELQWERCESRVAQEGEPSVPILDSCGLLPLDLAEAISFDDAEDEKKEPVVIDEGEAIVDLDEGEARRRGRVLLDLIGVPIPVPGTGDAQADETDFNVEEAIVPAKEKLDPKADLKRIDKVPLCNIDAPVFQPGAKAHALAPGAESNGKCQTVALPGVAYPVCFSAEKVAEKSKGLEVIRCAAVAAMGRWLLKVISGQGLDISVQLYSPVAWPQNAAEKTQYTKEILDEAVRLLEESLWQTLGKECLSVHRVPDQPVLVLQMLRLADGMSSEELCWTFLQYGACPRGCQCRWIHQAASTYCVGIEITNEKVSSYFSGQ